MKKFKLLRGYTRPYVDLDLQREITSRIMRQSRMINEMRLADYRADHIFLNTEWVTRQILGITE